MRRGTVTVHMQADGVKIMEPMIRYFCDNTGYDLRFEPLPSRGVVYEDDGLLIETFPLYHRVPCNGFIFREKPSLLNLRGDMVRFYQIPVRQLHAIKCGEDYVKDDGTVVPNSHLTLPPRRHLSYAYCSDTVMDSRVAKSVRGVDVLYHESTYADDQEVKAAQRGHSTARQAAKIASMSGVRHLILGHYSKRYRDLSPLLAEAREEFPSVSLSDEGAVFDLNAMSQ